MANQTIRYFELIIENARELTGREKDILKARLKNKTLKKIGGKNKITGERIRQIEEKILLKLTEKIRQLLLFD